MSDKKPKVFLIASAIIFILVLSSFWVISFKQRTTVKPPAGSPISTPAEEKNAPPTLSPERIEIIKEMKTLEVAIESTGFSPQNLTVRLYDQVTWTNKDTKNHKVTGEGWGKVTIGPGEKYTKTFEKAGTYSYTCGLQPELKGTVVVVEK